jgi:hypothetical protein
MLTFVRSYQPSLNQHATLNYPSLVTSRLEAQDDPGCVDSQKHYAADPAYRVLHLL